MIPNKIKIARREDWHTHYVGQFGDGNIFIGFPFFGGIQQTRPMAVLHLLDSNGNHTGSQIWETEKMMQAEQALSQAIDNLPGARFGDVMIRCFIVELNGMIFGFEPDEIRNRVNYIPYGLSFIPPWDGTYDT